jgi:hypothetical protein
LLFTPTKVKVLVRNGAELLPPDFTGWQLICRGLPTPVFGCEYEATTATRSPTVQQMAAYTKLAGPLGRAIVPLDGGKGEVQLISAETGAVLYEL